MSLSSKWISHIENWQLCCICIDTVYRINAWWHIGAATYSALLSKERAITG
jgi:hypothetical protein